MPRQYKRVYDLTIISSDNIARTIRDLRIQFEITKSVIGFPNLAKIDIYNAAPDTIDALQSEFTQIVLNAGYEGNVKLLFKGQVRNSFPSRKDVDNIITVYAGDGQRDWENTYFNKTFAANVTANSVIKDIIESFENLDVGALEGLPQSADKIRGQSLSGSSADLLDEFAKEYGFVWSIQDGEIITTPINAPLSGREAVVITAATGMIGSPTITYLGVEVKTLLNPQLVPNTAFIIESVTTSVSMGNLYFERIPKTNASGLYKALECIFKGDSREGEWTTFVRGLALNG